MKLTPAFVLALLLLSGCAPARPDCAPDSAEAVRAELLLGAGDDPAFDDFLDRSVTPRFPAGLTVLAADGRWRSPAGRQVRERSRVLLLLLPPDPDPRPALDAIRAEYRRRFRQQSVGLVLSRACASF